MPACAPSADFCVLDPPAQGIYVDLLQNPERFTGYAGDSSSRVWGSIYQENCFDKIEFRDPSRAADQGGQGFAPVGLLGGTSPRAAGGPLGGAWRAHEEKVLQSLEAPRDGGAETCLEKRVFYRLISGEGRQVIPAVGQKPNSLQKKNSRTPCLYFNSHLRRLSRSDDWFMGKQIDLVRRGAGVDCVLTPGGHFHRF